MTRLPEEVTRSYADSIAGCNEAELAALMADYEAARAALTNATKGGRPMKIIIDANKMAGVTKVLTDYAEAFTAEDDIGGTGAWIISARFPERFTDAERDEMIVRLKFFQADIV